MIQSVALTASEIMEMVIFGSGSATNEEEIA
jgi:hypothetical protein